MHFLSHISRLITHEYRHAPKNNRRLRCLWKLLDFIVRLQLFGYNGQHYITAAPSLRAVCKIRPSPCGVRAPRRDVVSLTHRRRRRPSPSAILNSDRTIKGSVTACLSNTTKSILHSFGAVKIPPGRRIEDLATSRCRWEHRRPLVDFAPTGG